MLGFLFGFNARIGRVYFLLASLAVGFVAGFVMITLIGHGMPRGSAPAQLIANARGWPATVVVIGSLWACVMLQSMRIRDIGWDPVCIVPALIALLILDRVVAIKVPAWSLTADHSGTAVGAVVNLVMFLVLQFWPGSGIENAPPRIDRPPPLPNPWSRTDTASVAASRIARVSNGEFGRRKA